MKPYEEHSNDLKNVMREDMTDYQAREADEDFRLREAINKSDTEKFRLFTRMLRITMMMQKAKITHKQV